MFMKDMKRWHSPSRWLKRMPTPGDLLVLINGGCFSTTGHLCSLLKYSGRCKFIGEETGGTYECNDSHVQVKTSATHLRLNVARMTYTAAVTGISRETGILPDYPVDPTIEDVITGHDAVKEFGKLIAFSPVYL